MINFLIDIFARLSGNRSEDISLHLLNGYIRGEKTHKKVDPHSEFEDMIRHSSEIRKILYNPKHYGVDPNSNVKEQSPKDDKYYPENTNKILLLKDTSFIDSSFNYTEFENVHFTNCRFTACHFKLVKFINCEFHRCEFKNCYFDDFDIINCYWDPESIKYSFWHKYHYSNILIKLYKKLYKNSDDAGQKQFKMYADIQFLKNKFWQYKYDLKNGKITRSEYFWNRAKSLFYDLTCGYGYSPLSFGVSTISFFAVVTWFNFLFLQNSQLKIGEDVVDNFSFWDSVYYTYTIMTAIGFSSVIPVTEFAKMVTVIEGFLGVICIGFLISVITKRVLN